MHMKMENEMKRGGRNDSRDKNEEEITYTKTAKREREKGSKKEKAERQLQRLGI